MSASLCEKYKMNIISYSELKEIWPLGVKKDERSSNLGSRFSLGIRVSARVTRVQAWKSVVSDMSWGIWWKICFVSRKVIASLIDGPLTSAKNYGRPNSSESEKLIRNKTILSLSALRIGLWFLSSSFWPHLTLVLLVWPFTFMIQPVTKCILIQIILVDEIDDHR